MGQKGPLVLWITSLCLLGTEFIQVTPHPTSVRGAIIEPVSNPATHRDTELSLLQVDKRRFGQSDGPLWGKEAPCKECSFVHKRDCCCCPCNDQVQGWNNNGGCKVPKCVGCQGNIPTVMRIQNNNR